MAPVLDCKSLADFGSPADPLIQAPNSGRSIMENGVKSKCVHVLYM